MPNDKGIEEIERLLDLGKSKSGGDKDKLIKTEPVVRLKNPVRTETRTELRKARRNKLDGE